MRISEQERSEAIEQLRELIKPGDTVRTILRHRSDSGMTHWISVVVVKNDEIIDVSWLAARVLGWSYGTRGHEGIRVGGCGMDMGFHLVYNLSLDLYPEYACLDPEHKSSAARCMQCRRTLVDRDGTWYTTGFHGEPTCYADNGETSLGDHVPGPPLSYGAKCPSSYHVNGGEAGGNPVHHDGYALSHRWL